MSSENPKPGKPDRVWVLEQFRRRNLAQKDVAALIGIDPATLSYTLKGERKLNLNELKKLSDLLRMPTSEIMARWGFPPEIEKPMRPLSAFALDDCTIVQASEPYALVPAPPGLATDSWALRVRSTDFPNSFWSGMVCFVSVGSLELYQCLGQLVVVHDEEGRALFGELSRGSEDGTYSLTHPLSKRQISSIRLSSATPIGWFKQG